MTRRTPETALALASAAALAIVAALLGAVENQPVPLGPQPEERIWKR